MMLWVATEVYELIIQDVHVFKTEAEALKWFKGYTGAKYGTNLAEGEFEDYDQTKIFEVEI